MTKNHISKLKRKTVVRAAFLFIICATLWIALFGCHIELFQPQKLAQAKDLWNAQNTSHYEEVFGVYGFCGFPCFSEIKIEVKDNQIMTAMWRDDFLIKDGPFKPVTQEQMQSGNLQNYTIDNLFERVTSQLQQTSFITLQMGNSRVYHMEYDPKLGFISRFEIDDCGQSGLLSGGVSDCRWGVTVQSVNILD